uniref:Uncharacterized protein n=1 Tax=Cucumis melo TaxID=3656 RepID=A0A9I9E9P9_CUCME
MTAPTTYEISRVLPEAYLRFRIKIAIKKSYYFSQSRGSTKLQQHHYPVQSILVAIFTSRDDLSTSQSSILHMKVPLRCDHSRSSHPVKACGTPYDTEIAI